MRGNLLARFGTADLGGPSKVGRDAHGVSGSVRRAYIFNSQAAGGVLSRCLNGSRIITSLIITNQRSVRIGAVINVHLIGSADKMKIGEIQLHHLVVRTRTNGN